MAIGPIKGAFCHIRRLMRLANYVRGAIPLLGGVAFLPAQGKKDGVVFPPGMSHMSNPHLMVMGNVSYRRGLWQSARQKTTHFMQ
jgi:hypothetical protein